MRFQNRLNCSCRSCSVRHVATCLDQVSQTDSNWQLWSHLLWKVKGHVLHLVASIHVEIMKAPSNWSVTHVKRYGAYANRTRSTCNLSDSKFWGQLSVIRLAFAESKDDHLLDPFATAQANWKVSSSFCPCILCPRILSLCSSSEHSQRFALHSWHLFPFRDVVTKRTRQLPWPPPWPWIRTQPWPPSWPWLPPWPWLRQWHDEGWLLATKHWRVCFLVHFGDY